MVSRERLLELFQYDAETGNLVRKIGRSGPKARAGDVAGRVTDKGYVRLYVDGSPYSAHRLIWFIKYGEYVEEIDHINGIKSDNRIENLRSVTRSQNRMNVGAYSNNKSGVRGVSWSKANNKWKAQIQKDGRKIGIGYFSSIDEAKEAYMKAASKHHGEYARAS